MNEERTGKCLRQVEHIRGHLWHRYSITVNQVMVATIKLSKWWLGSVASLFAATLYQINPDRNHKLWNIVSTERYIYSICRCCWNVATYKWKVHNGKIVIISFVKVSYLTAPHCQFRGVGQGMKQTYLYLWYLFQAQLDRCDRQNHQT